MEAVRSRMTGAGKRWDVTTGRGFMSYYDATFDDAYRTAARLAGGRRHVAEDLVQDAYTRSRRGSTSSPATGHSS
jgi:DNA-directed RNA polymerase specialized sigma24 family protein